MRPHDRSVRSKSSALARARMHLNAGLGWIRGFPVQVRGGRVEWVSVPAPGTGKPIEQITIDRERLRTASLALRKLLERHRGALARMVDDVPAWSRGVEQRLEALKAVIHRHAPVAGSAAVLSDAPPAAQRAARRAGAAYPGLVPLIDAVAWIHWAAAPATTRALRFVEARAEGLAGLLAGAPSGDSGPLNERYRGAVRLLDLVAADGEAKLAAVARVLSDPRSFTVALSAPPRLSESVERQLRKQGNRPPLEWPDRPAPEIGQAMLHAVPRLALLPDGPRRRALRLLSLVTPRGMTNRWAQWWRSADRVIAAVERRVQPSATESGRVDDLRRHLKSLQRLERAKPPAVPMLLLCAVAVDLTGEGEDERFVRELLRGVRAMPEVQARHALRLGFFMHWTGLHRAVPGAGALLRRCMAHTRGLLRDHRFPERVLTLWSHIPDRRPPTGWDLTRSPEGLLVHGELPPAQLGRLYRAVALAGWGDGGHPPLHLKDHTRWTVMLLLIAACPDAETAIAFARAVVDAGVEREVVHLPPTVAAALVPCAAGDPTRWVALIRVAAQGEFDAVAQLPAFIAQTGQAALVGDWLLAGEQRRVLAIAARHALVRALGAGRRVRLAGTRSPAGKAGTTKRSAAWMRRYPERLRPVLRSLAAVSDEAELQAGRVLGSAFPDPHALEREIAGLASRVARAVPAQAHAMRRRLASLQARLGAPARVSAARLRRFEDKLEARVRDRTLTAWEGELDRVAVPAIAAKVGAPLPAAWVSDTRRVRLLAQLAALEPAYRALAFKLVGVRLGPEPWDLRDHPANARWARATERRGIRLAPWIDGPAPQAIAGPGDTVVTLALEHDPLEVFRMGEPFGTCLSPGDFNFFSTVANAADLNKRVLFARDGEGGVVGRCLLALSRDDKVLTFHAYAHDGSWNFSKHLRRWARALAQAMGTELAPAGEVRTLVSPDWYDDGPVDLTGRFRWTRPTSPFAKSLPTMPPDTLLEWIDRIGGPGGLDTLTAPLLLAMDPLRNRRDLIAALLPRLARVAGLPPEHLLDAVNLIVHAPGPAGGEPVVPAAALQPLVRRLVSDPFWRRGYSRWHEERLVGACLATGLPSEALQVLRRTRARTVRSWDAECDDARIYAAARAHDALQRPAVALRLCERLARAAYVSCSSEAHAWAKQRAAALATQLDRTAAATEDPS